MKELDLGAALVTLYWIKQIYRRYSVCVCWSLQYVFSQRWISKNNILYYYLQGYKAPTILLHKEKIKASQVGRAKFIRKYEETRCLARFTGSGSPSKFTAEIKALVEEKMREDDETTAYQLPTMLMAHDYRISLQTVLWWCTSLGWTFHRSSYCQLMRKANKEKHLLWAQEYINDNFEMSCGQTIALCNWKPIGTFVVGSKASHYNQSRGTLYVPYVTTIVCI